LEYGRTGPDSLDDIDMSRLISEIEQNGIGFILKLLACVAGGLRLAKKTG